MLLKPVLCPNPGPQVWQGPFRAREYVDHVTRVPTPNVRGTATMYVEIAQETVVCFWFEGNGAGLS